MSDDLDRCDADGCEMYAPLEFTNGSGKRCLPCLIREFGWGELPELQRYLDSGASSLASKDGENHGTQPGTTLILDEAQDVGPERRWQEGPDYPPHAGGGEGSDTQPESDPDECWTFSCEDEPDGTLYSKTQNVETCETHGRRLSNDPTWGDYVPYEEQDASIQWGGE